jgi:hypothetical protein
MSEAFDWPEAMSDHRSVHRSLAEVPFGSLPKPGRAAVRTQSALQESRVRVILAAASAGMSARLCRLTC